MTMSWIGEMVPCDNRCKIFRIMRQKCSVILIYGRKKACLRVRCGGTHDYFSTWEVGTGDSGGLGYTVTLRPPGLMRHYLFKIN